MNNRVRYTVENIINNRFYQMPKFLLEGEFKGLSNDARVLYSLLRDRHELSLSNNWINENDEVYLIFTREDMAKLLGCSQPTLRKAIKQLIEIGLMEEERQGLNKPNIIFLTAVSIENTGVKNSFSPECKDFSVQNEKNFQSRVKESFSQECKNLSSNDTNINNTDISDTESVSLSKNNGVDDKNRIEKTDIHTDKIHEINKNRDIEKEKRERFNSFINHNAEDNSFIEQEISQFNYILQKAELDYIDPRYRDAVERALRELFFNNSMKIGGRHIPKWIVIKDLEKITYLIIDHALSKFKEASKVKQIKNTVEYLKTCIYNSIHEINLDIDSELTYQGMI
ncbi:replication initiator protein A [Proteiniborus sp. MB09-C3]|uniref:replication initiator protein A n=1 Tax=Proteiniborus sp. MB09-C3 TaxID=3050072 RepID=UPI0025523124|nr:replication initiator protein A [Proteiniborus sp. MB09-C3]WIV11104.1 replication initiator protein A [Proteiniborus sp. MB09-C3]